MFVLFCIRVCFLLICIDFFCLVWKIDLLLEMVNLCLKEGRFSVLGFWFYFMDEELVVYYLKRKICGRKFRINVIGVVDVYKVDFIELFGNFYIFLFYLIFMLCFRFFGFLFVFLGFVLWLLFNSYLVLGFFSFKVN